MSDKHTPFGKSGTELAGSLSDVIDNGSRIEAWISEDIRKQISDSFSLEEYTDGAGVDHLRLAVPLVDVSEADDIWEVYDYDSLSALLDIGIIPEEFD